MSFLKKLFGDDSQPKPSNSQQPCVLKLPRDQLAVCDVCSTKLEWSQGFGLTTTQIVTRESYWEYLFMHQGYVLHEQDPKGDEMGRYVAGQANHMDVWLICESCSTMFEFDREVARQFTCTGKIPPGVGPANVGLASYAAGYAWSKVFDKWPSSLRFRNEAHPNDTLPCDFCRRWVHSDEKICLLDEGALEVYESEKGLVRRGGPSFHAAGKPSWVACPVCIRRAHRIMGRVIGEPE